MCGSAFKNKGVQPLLDAIIHMVAGAIDAKSPYTHGHCQRVPELAKELASEDVIAVDTRGPHGESATRHMVGFGGVGIFGEVSAWNGISAAMGGDTTKILIIALVGVLMAGGSLNLGEIVAAQAGPISILVNNAGIAGPTGPVDEIAPEDWDHCLSVCLTGQFLCTHHAVPLIKAAGGGSIVNISSAAGRFGYAFRTPGIADAGGRISCTSTFPTRSS